MSGSVPSVGIKAAAAAGITAAAAASVAGSLLLLHQSASHAALPSSPHLATVPDSGVQETELEPECDCAPLWECMEKREGGCGILEKKLRDCLAKNRRTLG